MSKIKELFIKYKSFISYAFFGVCTTLINWGTYYLCYNITKIPNVISTIIAWVIAVAFAFITNKIWVFDSKSFKLKTLIYEIWTFLAARLVTGVLDVAIMYFAVDVLAMNSTIWKLLSNIIVIIVNYILSKFIVFKKDNSEQPEE
ncbi:MAG: GtrA family protein [Acutalibacteraceae bacterium]